MKHFLSVVIPAYNEEKSLKAGNLGKVYEYLKSQSFPWEVLVVDDGSTDSTLKLSKVFAGRFPGFRVLGEPHRGKGGAVIAGMLKAKGDIVLFTDMDQATPITQLNKVLPKFDAGYDIVIGSRSGRQGAPFIRKVMAYGFSALRFLVLRLSYKDTQKVGKRESAYQVREFAANSFIQGIEGTEFGFVAVEEGRNMTRVSFRSRRDFDVSRIAVELGGGGHKAAAGGRINLPLKEVLKKVLMVSRKYSKNGS